MRGGGRDKQSGRCKLIGDWTLIVHLIQRVLCLKSKLQSNYLTNRKCSEQRKVRTAVPISAHDVSSAVAKRSELGKCKAGGIVRKTGRGCEVATRYHVEAVVTLVSVWVKLTGVRREWIVISPLNCHPAKTVWV
jgi:hypothetical protein